MKQLTSVGREKQPALVPRKMWGHYLALGGLILLPLGFFTSNAHSAPSAPQHTATQQQPHAQRQEGVTHPHFASTFPTPTPTPTPTPCGY